MTKYACVGDLVDLVKLVLWAVSECYIAKKVPKYIVPEVKGDECEDFISAERELSSRWVRYVAGMLVWGFFTLLMSLLLHLGASKRSVWECSIWVCLTVIEMAVATFLILKVPADADTQEYRKLVCAWYAINAVCVIMVFIFIKKNSKKSERDEDLPFNEHDK